jgi:voltage-gated potassium channel
MATAIANARQWLALNRQSVLFGLLVLTVAIGPLLAALPSGRTILNVCLGLTLLATTVSPMEERASGRGFFIFVALAIALGLAPLRTPLGDPGPIMMAVWSAIAFIAAARALRYAVSSSRIDLKHLLAALNAYLLVGVFLGAIWVVIDELSPGALLQGGQPIADFSLPDGIYFSFVTLATLGYGDITPVTPIARGLAVFEAVFGQLYLAVMVARLVSLRIAGESRDAQ